MIALVLVKNNLFKKVIILSTINPIIILSIILTGERTASIIAFIFVLVSSFLIIDKIKYRIFYFISAVLIVSSVFHFNSNLKSRFVDDTLNYMIDSKYKKYIILKIFLVEVKKYISSQKFTMVIILQLLTFSWKTISRSRCKFF